MSREYFEALEKRFRDGATDGITVSRYRMSWRAFETLSVGVRDNALAGVYTPLRSERAVSGSFLLEWSDGLVSQGNLDGASLDNFEEMLESAAQARREDPDTAVFPGPAEPDRVPLHSDDVAELFESDPEPIVSMAAFLKEHGAGIGALNTNAGVTAMMGTGGVWTSEGMRLEGPHTTFGFWSWLDGETGEGFGWRKRFSLDDVKERLAMLEVVFGATREERPWGEAREATVVLHPMAAESFLNHFLLSNLSGPAVYHGQSRWKPEDFESGLPVFRDDFTLRVEPNVPYHYGSYNYTTEGVIARPTDYVRGGRLCTPVLNLKYARRMGLEATSPPRTGESMRIDLGSTETWDECLARAGEGVVVTNVLGMHTQDQVRGDYSLAVPTAIRMDGGRLDGKARVVLNDNFFDNLSASDLTAVTFPHHDLPGLAFRSRVSPDKG